MTISNAFRVPAFIIMTFAAQLSSASLLWSSEEPASPTSFQLQAGNRLKIAVYREVDLTGSYEITAAGTLSFPLIGEFQVAGLQVEELRHLLEQKLRKYLISPQVTINRDEATIKTISVLGKIKNAGAFDYSPGLTLMRLISEAGGFDKAANPRKIRIVRMVEGEKKLLVFNGSQIINGEQDDPLVEPGDMVFVPEAVF